MKKLYSVKGNSQKLDGGAMFGNAPKAVWQKWVEVDQHNRIDLACRALLVKDNGFADGRERNILFEVGVGAFFEPKLKQRYGVVENNHVLLDSLAAIGLSHQQIDVIVLSHLHFDHAGGLFSQWQQDHPLELLFPNAAILVGEQAWQRALNPHYRDRASFIPELISQLQQRDNLHIVNSAQHPILGDDYSFHYSNGHTPGMLLTEVALADGPMVFCADLIPGEPWVHLPITMGYDRYAEKLIDEKEVLLADLLARNGRLFFTHDTNVAAGKLAKNDKNKYYLSEKYPELVDFCF